jgi:hypothetical protein
MAVTQTGDIFVTGYGYDEATQKDMITLRLDDSGGLSDVAEVPTAAIGLEAWPNPFNPRVNLAFDLPRAADVRLAVFDLRGRQVAVLLDESLAPGPHLAHWDGRLPDGQVAASGVYLAIVDDGLVRSSRKIILAK